MMQMHSGVPLVVCSQGTNIIVVIIMIALIVRFNCYDYYINCSQGIVLIGIIIIIVIVIIITLLFLGNDHHSGMPVGFPEDTAEVPDID